VLFKQTRVGRNSQPFPVLKLRTMVVDAEAKLAELHDLNEADGPLFKMAEDPRITRTGRFLRKMSIDEIPQLWNVLRGEMSLVGPRPALPHETEEWDALLTQRLRVKPGITGMWQVNGRSNASFEDYTRLDLYYVDNWSLTTDIAILMKTIPVVMFRQGAV
jgi:lipopolysaccharide/colanic/teichoic acid biosynthesis glycosyltransferase